MPKSIVREHILDGVYNIYIKRRDGTGSYDYAATYPCEHHIEALDFYSKLAKNVHAFMVHVPGTVIAITE